MIRRKKDQDDNIMAPLSEEDDMEEIVLEDVDDIADIDEDQTKTKDKKKKFSLKRKAKKKKAPKEKEETPEQTELKDDEDYDPLNLKEDGAEYLKMEEEKKLPVKRIILFAGIAIVLIGVAISFVIKNIDSGSSREVYVQSVAELTGYGTANGGSNRYTGVVEPQSSWKIQLEADMSVSKCYVKVGQEVKKGEKLFVYNTEELKLNQEKKELELSNYQNEINQLTKDIETYQKDLKSASASEKIELQTQILTAQTTIKKDEFGIKTAKEEITKIKKTIKDATVKSKMDGVVKSINQSLGNGSSDDDDNSSMNNSSEDNSTYMTILAVGDYRIKGKITETNANSLSEGQAVIIRSRTEEKTWKGTIENVKTDATADSDSSQNSDMYESDSGTESASNYNFYVELKDDEGLMMGQHVFVELDYGQDDEKEGVWISSAFIIVEDDNYYAWVDDGHDRLKKVKLEIGEYDETMDEYQVLSGIEVTDYIACDDLDLKEGMKTTKVDPDSMSDEETDNSDSEEGMGDEFEEGDDLGDSVDSEESNDDNLSDEDLDFEDGAIAE